MYAPPDSLFSAENKNMNTWLPDDFDGSTELALRQLLGANGIRNFLEDHKKTYAALITDPKVREVIR